MLIQIAITCDNAAFDTYPAAEAARILRRFADRLESDNPTDGAYGTITGKDLNGNTVATLTITT